MKTPDIQKWERTPPVPKIQYLIVCNEQRRQSKSVNFPEHVKAAWRLWLKQNATNTWRFWDRGSEVTIILEEIIEACRASYMRNSTHWCFIKNDFAQDPHFAVRVVSSSFFMGTERMVWQSGRRVFQLTLAEERCSSMLGSKIFKSNGPFPGKFGIDKRVMR